MKETPIQWCDDTANPVAGCDTCELWTEKRKTCYAGILHLRYPENNGYARRFEVAQTFPGRMAKAAALPDLTGTDRTGPKNPKPWLNKSPRLIFVSDMGDALSDRISFAYLDAEVIASVETPAGRRHRWLWLTKKPERMAEFSAWLKAKGRSWPRNLWAGTSVTLQKMAEKRVPHLLKVGDQSTTRFLSVEPQWEEISLAKWLKGRRIAWVIAGGESKQPERLQGLTPTEPIPFNLDWARKLMSECSRYGVSFFLKQLGSRPIDDGKPLQLKDEHGGNSEEWPKALRRRQLPRMTRR